MTPQLTTEAFAALGAPDLVYIRPVLAKDILGATPVEDVQGFEITPDQTLYAVHRADAIVALLEACQRDPGAASRGDGVSHPSSHLLKRLIASSALSIHQS